MRTSVFSKDLWEGRRGLLWWALGLAGYVAVIAAVWPSIRDNPALVKLHETYPETLKAFVSFGGEFDLNTPAGYLGAELFSLMIPLLLIVAAIAAGARSLAGEEEQGTLELLLANPISRRRLALEKLAALVVELLMLAAIIWAALWIGTRATNMRISGAHLLASVTMSLALALAYGAIASLIGALTGRRAHAIAISSALAAAAYLINGLAPLVHTLHHIRATSPWYHYAASNALRHGLTINHTLVLLAIMVTASVLTPLVFERRDLTTT